MAKVIFGGMSRAAFELGRGCRDSEIRFFRCRFGTVPGKIGQIQVQIRTQRQKLPLNRMSRILSSANGARVAICRKSAKPP